MNRVGRVASIVAAVAAAAGSVEGSTGLNFCTGPSMEWVAGPSDPAQYPICGSTPVSCEPVQSSGPTYAVQSGCDPQTGPCSVTATVPAFFPDNDGNTIAFGPNAATTLFYGPAVGTGNETCGVEGDFIQSDNGTVTVSAQVDCSSPGELLRTLRISYCQIWTAGCRFFRDFPLDFRAAAGCKQPPLGGCGRGDSAVAGACCIGPGGGAPGIGGGASSFSAQISTQLEETPQVVQLAGLGHSVEPEQGAPPGFHLTYTFGGAGGPGYPEAPHWKRHLGQFWSHQFSQRIVAAPDESRVWFVSPGGAYREFSDPDAGGIYQSVRPADEYRTLEWLGSGQGWVLQELDGSRIYFRDDGLWERTELASDPGPPPNPPVTTQGAYDPVENRLTEVQFPDGREVELTYYADGQLQKLREVGVDGVTFREWTYEWYLFYPNYGILNDDNLRRLTRPDGSAWVFDYDSATDANSPVIPHMTRMTLFGGGSSRIEGAWEYDTSRRLIRSWRGAATYAAAQDPEKLTWSYPLADTVQVTDGYGSVRTYVYDRESASGKARLLSFSGDCPACGGLLPNSSYQYLDGSNPLRPTQITDGSGTATVLTYNSDGMLTSKREAQGHAPLDRTTEWEYQGPFPGLVTKTKGPSPTTPPPGPQVHSRVTTLDYEADGDLSSRLIEGIETDDPSTQTPFDYLTEYTHTAERRPATIDPPGYFGNDATEWEYTDSSRPLHPTRREDPLLGPTGTTFTWDEFNRKKTETDQNGHKTEWSYDALGRVTEVRVHGDPSTSGDDLVTLYKYTGLGDLGCVKFPRGNGVQYLYNDPLGRPTEIIRGTAQASPTAANCLTNTAREHRFFTYTLDANGYKVNEKLERWLSGSSWEKHAEREQHYEASCRISKSVDGANNPGATTTAYGYDCNGNLGTETRAQGSPIETTTTYLYDRLNRLQTVRQTWGGSGGGLVDSVFGYDAQDHLTSVTDGELNQTTYLYSDRDRLTRQTSPVTGVTRYLYNEHGEQIEEHQDGRGISILREVDAADRVTFVDYPGTVPDISYTWVSEILDAPSTEIKYGHLFAISRSAQTINYGYDVYWRLNADGALAFTLDGNGNRLTVQYPQGITARTTYDYADRPSKLELDEGSGFSYVVGSGGTAASYRAFGPLWTLPFANTRTETRTFDMRLAPDAISLSGSLLSWDYTVDALGDVTTIDDTLASNLDRSFGYQSHQRYLTCASGPWASSGSCAPSPTGGRLQWSYDKTGNRKTEVKSGTGSYSDTYVYPLNGSGGNGATLDRVDRAGSGVLRDYAFDGGGFLDTVVAGANTVNFDFDAAGQLTQTSRAAQSLSYVYDGRGYLRLFPVQTTGDPPCPTPPPGEVERFCDGFGTGNAACWSSVVGGGGGGTCPWQPTQDRVDVTYSSDGRLFGLDRTPAGSTVTRHAVLYFGDQPIVQWRKPTSGASERFYLTADHLGTPIVATSGSGSVVWSGGFEPFGRDYTNPTAEASGIYLRLPGQWEDLLFNSSTLGADLYYNVHRWFEQQTSRYASVDPMGYSASPNPYSYVNQRPLRATDPLGLYVIEIPVEYKYGQPGVTFPRRSRVDYDCYCCGTEWCTSFRVRLEFDLYAHDDCSLRHEEGHITLYEQFYVKRADPILIPLERQRFTSKTQCEDASRAALKEFVDEINDDLLLLGFQHEVMYDLNPFLLCGP